MMKGFYNLTSGMASQQNRLNVVANNMTNISTAGYKAEHYTDRTFDEVMVSRIGNIDKSHYQTMETYQSHILAPDHLYTDFIQGSLEETNLPLDFAIQGEGFFAIQTVDGVEVGFVPGLFVIIHQKITYCIIKMAVAGVHQHAGSLVEDDQIRVLIYKVQGAGGGDHPGRGRGVGEPDGQGLALPHPDADVDPRPVQGDAVLQPLHPPQDRAGQPQDAAQEGIHFLAVLGLGDQKL